MVLTRYEGERLLNAPNAITVGRIIGGTREAWRYYHDPRTRRLWVTGAFFSLDLVDGWLARRLGQTTQFGGDLDKVGDKLTGGLMLLGGMRARSADRAVLMAVTAINGSNVAATAVGLIRNTVPDGVPEVNRTTQALMNYGVGFNMIGNHMRRESASVLGRRVGKALRIAGATSSIIGASVFGTAATARLWRTVLAPGAPDAPQPPHGARPQAATTR